MQGAPLHTSVHQPPLPDDATCEPGLETINPLNHARSPFCHLTQHPKMHALLTLTPPTLAPQNPATHLLAKAEYTADAYTAKLAMYY